MKKLVVALVLFTTLGFGQKSIIVKSTTCQNITWPLTTTLKIAQDSNLINYPNYVVGENTWKFDFINKSLSILDSTGKVFKFIKFDKIIKNESDWTFEYKLPNSILSGKMVLAKKINDEYTIIGQYNVFKEDSTFKGYICDDITVSIK